MKNIVRQNAIIQRIKAINCNAHKLPETLMRETEQRKRLDRRLAGRLKPALTEFWDTSSKGRQVV